MKRPLTVILTLALVVSCIVLVFVRREKSSAPMRPDRLQITGMIFDAHGKPVHALVSFVNARSNDPNAESNPDAVWAPGGEYWAAHLKPGEYYVKAKRYSASAGQVVGDEWYHPDTREKELRKAITLTYPTSNPLRIDLHMGTEPPPAWEFFVRDEKGKPVQKAELRVQGGGIERWLSTDDAGRAELRDPARGTFKVSVAKLPNPYAPKEKEVKFEIPSSEKAITELTVKEGLGVSGVFEWEGERPKDLGFYVDFYDDSGRHPRVEAETDGKGFRATGLVEDVAYRLRLVRTNPAKDYCLSSIWAGTKILNGNDIVLPERSSLRVKGARCGSVVGELDEGDVLERAAEGEISSALVASSDSTLVATREGADSVVRGVPPGRYKVLTGLYGKRTSRGEVSVRAGEEARFREGLKEYRVAGKVAFEPTPLMMIEYDTAKPSCVSAECPRFVLKRSRSLGATWGLSFVLSENAVAVIDEPYLQLFELATGKRLGGIGSYAGGYAAYDVSNDGRFLVAGESHIALWSIGERRALKKLSGVPGRLESLFFSEDGKNIFGSSVSGNVTYLLRWSVESEGAELLELDIKPRSEAVSGLRLAGLTKEGEFLLSDMGVLRVFDKTSFKRNLETEGELNTVSSALNTIVTTSVPLWEPKMGDLIFWDVSRGKEIKRTQLPHDAGREHHKGSFRGGSIDSSLWPQVELSLDLKLASMTIYKKPEVVVFETAGGSVVHQLKCPDCGAEDFAHCYFAPDASYLGCISWQDVAVWRLKE